MKILLVGRWGKTHALAKALKSNKDVKLFSLMDKKNQSIIELSEEYQLIDLTDKDEIERYVLEKKFDLVVITPEMTLKTGITDILRQIGVPTVGASKTSSLLESDKVFLRKLLKRHKFDAAVDYQVFYNKNDACNFLKKSDQEYAIKPAGVTDGEGVKVMGKQLENRDEAMEYIEYIFKENLGKLPYILLEERLIGEEFSLQAFTDGNTLVPMPAVRDYKMLREGDSGTNTPGMGAYSDVNHLLPFLSRTTYEQAADTLRSILKIMQTENGAIYKGFITGQFMLTENGMKLFEINVRPGDAEILNIIPILETDFTEICMAIAEGTLNKLKISYAPKATVSKYIVPPGFPLPSKKAVRLEIDKDMIREKGGTLFQSCFDVAENIFEPSPRLFAVTATAGDIYTAGKKCEECLKHIKGEGLYHRRDIGTKELTELYNENQKSIC